MDQFLFQVESGLRIAGLLISNIIKYSHEENNSENLAKQG